MWHHLVPEDADESRCADPECGIVVEDEIADLLFIECPAPPCTDPANADLSCRFVPDDDGEPVCAYCERCGSTV